VTEKKKTPQNCSWFRLGQISSATS
jgi:hypothetical protein